MARIFFYFKVCITLTLVIAATLAAGSAILLMAIIKFALWNDHLRNRCTTYLLVIPDFWTSFVKYWTFTFLGVRVEVEYADELHRDHRYLVLPNHQSWLDIVLLFSVFRQRSSPLNYFMKWELLYIPIVGQACWAMGFPFMRRYSHEQIQANPELKEKDAETTRRACQQLKQRPMSFINFIEGTRNRPEKHRKQNSPFQHLLKPRAGGVAYVLQHLGDQINSVIEVDLVYPEGHDSVRDLLSGKMDVIRVYVRKTEIPAVARSGDYQADPDYRQYIQEWVGQLWQAKDERLRQLRAG